MAIHITPAILERVYELLRATLPFKGWCLPHADEVEFHVTRVTHTRGDHCMVRGQHVIRISAACHQTIASTVMTMAHEMIHLHETQIGVRQDIKHGRDFKRFARQVCKAHGFEDGLF